MRPQSRFVRAHAIGEYIYDMRLLCVCVCLCVAEDLKRWKDAPSVSQALKAGLTSYPVRALTHEETARLRKVS